MEQKSRHAFGYSWLIITKLYVIITSECENYSTGLITLQCKTVVSLV